MNQTPMRPARRLRWLISVPLAMWLPVGIGAHAAPSEPVPVRGSRLVMIRPEGFADASAFTGFVHTESSAAIVVSEIRAPVARLLPSITDQNLARQGMETLSRESVRIQGREGVLIRASQRKETDYEKWLLVFGDSEWSFMVNASWPVTGAAGASRPGPSPAETTRRMRDCVMSVTVSGSASFDDPFADLSFRLEPAAGLRYADRRGKTLFFTTTGKMPEADSNEPLLAVGTTFSTFDVTQQRTFAETRLGLTDGIRDMRIEISRACTIDDLAAHEIVAHAADRATGREVTLYQLLVFEDARVFHFVLGRADAEAVSPPVSWPSEFLRTGHSLRRNLIRRTETDEPAEETPETDGAPPPAAEK